MNITKINKAIKVAIAFGTVTSAMLVTNTSMAEESAEDVERIQVTGSRIKRTDIESATPISVITADELLVKGFTNVQDALSSLSSVTGSMNQQSIHGFTPAASSINLRNAGANRTLT